MFSHIFKFFLIAMTLSSCSNFVNTKPDARVWSDVSNKIALVQISEFQGPAFHREGGQGLLDVAINNSVTGDVSTVVSKIDYQKIIDNIFYDKYSKKINELGAQTTSFRQPYFYKDLVKVDAKKQEYLYSLDFLKQQGFSHAVVFQPLMAGTKRRYYGFIPLNAPQGMANINCYVVDLSTNMAVGFYFAASVLPCASEWDQPPYFEALKESSMKAFQKSLDSSYAYFFEN